jgi:hypothetical protein
MGGRGKVFDSMEDGRRERKEGLEERMEDGWEEGKRRRRRRMDGEEGAGRERKI